MAAATTSTTSSAIMTKRIAMMGFSSTNGHIAIILSRLRGLKLFERNRDGEQEQAREEPE